MSPYCSSCGEEVAAEASFCSNCGADVGTTAESSQDTVADEPAGTDEAATADGWKGYLPGSWQIGVVGVGFGFFIGLLIAWALLEIGGSGGGFLLGLLGGTLYLWQKPTASGAIGTGLYISALLLILVPILFYGGMIADVGEEPETPEETGMVVGGLLGMVLWGFVFGLIAIVVGSLGYFFKRREKKKLASS